MRPALTSAARGGFVTGGRDGGTAAFDRTEERVRERMIEGTVQRSFPVQTGTARPITEETSEGPK